MVKVNRRGNWVLVRLSTEDGLSGIGDASHGGNDRAVMSLVEQFFDALRGRGLWELESFRQQILPEVAKRGRAAAVAYSALEQCLWDLRGKSVGLPVYELLGGRIHEKVRNYANINRSTEDRSPGGFARMAERAAQAGFDAVKLAPFDDMPRRPADEAEIAKYMQLGVDCGAAVRKAIGEKADLLIDVHSHFDLAHGLELLRRFEPQRLFWIEEVTRSTQDLPAIRRESKMPTAGGESLFGVKGFYPYIAAGAVDIVMPDIKYAGGIFEVKKIAAMAEGAGLKVAPHGPASPVGNAAAAQICVTLPNFHILEFSLRRGAVALRIDRPARATRERLPGACGAARIRDHPE